MSNDLTNDKTELRDRIAMHAALSYAKTHGHKGQKWACEMGYIFADKMLKTREGQNNLIPDDTDGYWGNYEFTIP